MTDLESGGDLMSLIQRQGTLSLYAIRFYAANMVEVLDYLHSNAIAHRDVKPENVMISTDGYLKIIDFGSAKARALLTPRIPHITLLITSCFVLAT